jgi:hypothetical protein
MRGLKVVRMVGATIGLMLAGACSGDLPGTLITPDGFGQLPPLRACPAAVRAVAAGTSVAAAVQLPACDSTAATVLPRDDH